MRNNPTFRILLLAGIFLLTFTFQCKNDDPVNNPITDINNTLGFGLLSKIEGIWNGPITSSTPIGGFPEWIVDFRPISENQISAKNELDKLNDIHMSFFITKYNNEFRVCFRSGGLFNGQTRVSYFLTDSVSESPSESYYRLAEILNGKKRAYTEVSFNGDSLIMRKYTNHSNTLSTPSLHMTWRAKLQDITSCAFSIAAFNFPKKTLTKDFSSSFAGKTEAIFFNLDSGDPYTESQQPYLGKATISYTYGPGYVPDPNKKTILIITTQPLISGLTFNFFNLKYRSRYVVLSSTDQSFIFNYMHPGTYYLYVLYDADGNNTFNSGDWASTTNTSFTLSSQSMINATTQINFTIP